jgi:hypothetical protein
MPIVRKSIPDLWPTNLGTPNLRAPVAILRKQATAIAEKTGGIVEGKITAEVRGTTFNYSFWLVAPALGNYSYRLFSIDHDANYYPLRIIREFLGDQVSGVKVKSEEEFIERLKEILSHEKTIHIIHSLITQSQALAK